MSFSSEDLKRAIHPKESSRFAIALIMCGPALVLALIVTFASFGMILLFVALIVFFVWIVLSIAKAYLIANSVKVSGFNFPDIYTIYNEVKDDLGYVKNVDIYIIEEGSVNAFLAKFFGTKFIILNSGLVKGMRGGNSLQMKWIIARFIGSLKAKHFRLDILRILVDSIEKVKIFNLFILPYERATQYTGDNIGLLVCQDVPEVFEAFGKFLVGNDLSSEVNFKGLLEQGKDIRGSFFAFLARITSSHPHQVDRYLNLLAYSNKEFPDQFDSYIKDYDKQTILKLGYLLPDYKG